MGISAGNNEVSFDPNEKENAVEDLYESNATANNNDFRSTSAYGFISSAYGFAEAERQWIERAAAINAERRLEKKIERKVYKRLIKELLKKI